MKFEVFREQEDEKLVFKIQVSCPRKLFAKNNLEEFTGDSNQKEKIVFQVTSELAREIDHAIGLRINHICQEIYNWVYDSQAGEAKKWLQKFDPQRTKYYFDNDITIESDYIMDF